MARARQRLNERSVFEFGQRMLRLTTRSPQQRRMLDRLVVKSGGTTRFVRVADIDCIEAAGVYVSLHVAGKKLLYRATLQELVARLDAMRFVRVHRSAVVNIESIVQLEPRSHGEFDVVLRHGSRSRSAAPIVRCSKVGSASHFRFAEERGHGLRGQLRIDWGKSVSAHAGASGPEGGGTKCPPWRPGFRAISWRVFSAGSCPC